MADEGFIRIPDEGETQTAGPSSTQQGMGLSWPLDHETQQTLRRWLAGTTSGETGGSLTTLPGGSDTQIQFNDAGVFGGDSALTWDKTNNLLSITDGSAQIRLYPSGSALVIDTGSIDCDGFDFRSDRGNIAIQAGTISGANGGGRIVSLTAGNSAGSGNAGDASVVAGDADVSGMGGNAWLKAGQTQAPGGGDVYILPSGTYGAGGDKGNVLIYQEGENTFLFLGSANQAKEMWNFQNQTTTNATPTIVNVITMSASSSAMFETRVHAIRTGGTAGTAQDSASYVRRATYKRVGAAAPTLVGAIQDDFTVEDQAGWDCTFVVSTNTIQVQVTGAADNNISWQVITRMITTVSY